MDVLFALDEPGLNLGKKVARLQSTEATSTEL
jgi:hypothetical protein